MCKSAENRSLVFGAFQIVLVDRCGYVCVCRSMCVCVCVCVRVCVSSARFWCLSDCSGRKTRVCVYMYVCVYVYVCRYMCVGV